VPAVAQAVKQAAIASGVAKLA
jgi:hypothetical protein